MKTESVGICCAILQVDTNELLITIPIMHTPMCIKRILSASCNHRSASWLSVAI